MSPVAIPYSVASYAPSIGGALEQAHEGDAGYDLAAAEDVYLAPGDRALVKTGVRVAIPEGHAGLVLPRSGLFHKYGITVGNTPGLIDPGYRGEVGVLLHNTTPVVEWDSTEGRWVSTGTGRFIERGDRIAQLLVIRTADVRFQLAMNIGDYTERGEGGFGSTGR